MIEDQIDDWLTFVFVQVYTVRFYSICSFMCSTTLLWPGRYRVHCGNDRTSHICNTCAYINWAWIYVSKVQMVISIIWWFALISCSIWNWQFVGLARTNWQPLCSVQGYANFDWESISAAWRRIVFVGPVLRGPVLTNKDWWSDQA